jgi:ammonium transporter Rh
MCFWVAALAVQYYFLFDEMWFAIFHGNSGKFSIGMSKLIVAEYSAFAIVIALCAVLGKANSLQLFIMTILGSVLFNLNKAIVVTELLARDIGGGMTIHTFGAFFGIGVSMLLNYPSARGSLNLFQTQDSLTSAMIGTLFLWCFWPSFNSALALSGEEANMAIINTYFAMIGSVLSAYMTSLVMGKGRFTMSHILRATLAGGVVMGSGADLLHDGYVAFIVGNLIGMISTFSYISAEKKLDKTRSFDVAGVFALHAIPGFLGSGVLSSIFRAQYIDNGGWRQIIGALISVGIGLVGGLIVGAIIKGLHYYEHPNDFFNDRANVALESHVLVELNIYGGSHSQKFIQAYPADNLLAGPGVQYTSAAPAGVVVTGGPGGIISTAGPAGVITTSGPAGVVATNVHNNGYYVQ